MNRSGFKVQQFNHCPSEANLSSKTVKNDPCNKKQSERFPF